MILDGAARARTTIWLATALACLAGCPTPRPPSAPPAASPSQATLYETENIDGRATQFFGALRAGDDVAATRYFGPQLAHEVTPARIQEIRQALAHAYGPIVGWECTRKVVENRLERREYQLRFARGAMAVHVTFHTETERMMGLFFMQTTTFEPAPTPGLEAFLSTLDASVGPGLGATITLPRGAGGRLMPAAVLVPGSGPNDRDETAGPARPLRDLAEGLAMNGVVTIRFDKRVFVHPELFTRGLFTVDEEVVQDALSAVAVVKRQPLVDGKRVFVVGHSLGAQLAPEIATRAGDVAGLVMIAAPGRPFFDVLLDQVKRTGRKDVIARVEKAREFVNDPLSNPIQYVEGAPIAYYRDLAARNEFEFARNFKGPILLLRGADDTNVLDLDQQAWIRNLAGRSDVTARTIPGLTHYLAPGLDLAMARAGVVHGRGARVSDVVVDEIARFVNARR